jgi:hypothetical protein
MIWFTLRQFRAQLVTTLAAFAVVGVALVVTGLQMANLYRSLGLPGCRDNCQPLLQRFVEQAQGKVYLAAIVQYVVPVLIGVFWGAPLFTREFEAGTHRLAWNQSVTRTRWLATKLVVLGLVSMATTGLLGLAISVWARRVDEAAMDRITPFLFGARGVVPLAYAAFAVALGVSVGLLIRRTVPAMAATFAIYLASAVTMLAVVRQHLLPTSHAIRPLDTTNLYGIIITPDQMTLIGPPEITGAWVLSNDTITVAGHVFTGPADRRYCGPSTTMDDCLGWIDSLHLRQAMTYHPASQFWALQWIEAGIYVAATLLLAAFCFWWVRRRPS